MTNATKHAKTPHYVLKSGSQAIFPTINFENQTTNCICVYGFSDKPIYDQFIKSVEQILTPYPLVKRYLSSQIAEAKSASTNGHNLCLVILDATDHDQPLLSATTMAAVLLAQQENAKDVAVEFSLVYEEESASYRVEKD